MSKLIDLKHKIFGKLTVIKRAGKTVHGHLLWLCKCECGKLKKISGMNLKKKITQSCGCIRIHQIRKALRLPKGEAGFNTMFCAYRTRSKAKKIKFKLSKKQFKQITKQNCYYCGKKPKQISHTASKDIESIKHSSYIYNGIDRLNNNKGYIKNNVVPCCKSCNFFKVSLHHKEFLKLVKKIYEYRIKK